MAEAVSTLTSLNAAYTKNTTSATVVDPGDDRAILSDDFDAFLLLLTTQMTNQDPLEPMDSSEFTNQLVAFADVEQSIKQTGQLETLVSSASTEQSLNAANYIGLESIVPGSEFNLDILTDDNGDPVAREEVMTYFLPQDASTGAITIRDSSGAVVFTANIQAGQGEYNVSWDGIDNAGNLAEAGAYSFTISAQNSDGDPIEDITTATRGVVTSVKFENGETILTLDGKRNVRMDEITGVGLPGNI